MSRNSNTILAFLLGAVAGSAVAILFAPDKGEVTRTRLKRGANDLYDRSKDWVGDTTQGLRGKAGDVADRAKGVAHDVAGAARQQVDAVKGAVSEGKDAYRRELDKP